MSLAHLRMHTPAAASVITDEQALESLFAFNDQTLGDELSAEISALCESIKTVANIKLAVEGGVTADVEAFLTTSPDLRPIAGNAEALAALEAEQPGMLVKLWEKMKAFFKWVIDSLNNLFRTKTNIVTRMAKSIPERLAKLEKLDEAGKKVADEKLAKSERKAPAKDELIKYLETTEANVKTEQELWTKFAHVVELNQVSSWTAELKTLAGEKGEKGPILEDIKTNEKSIKEGGWTVASILASKAAITKAVEAAPKVLEFTNTTIAALNKALKNAEAKGTDGIEANSLQALQIAVKDLYRQRADILRGEMYLLQQIDIVLSEAV